MTRKTKKFTKPVFFDKQGLRLSTPEIVAEYIAKRLKTSIIADLGCGIGGQVIFFGKECKKVYAVEKNLKRLEYAKKNCELYGVKNVEFIYGDALSKDVKKRISDSDIIFSDPARPLSEKERLLTNLEPPILKILDFYSDITDNFAFHIPPQIQLSKLTGLNCEKEYLSLNGELNRFTIYFGNLKSAETSAIILPQGSYLSYSNHPKIKHSVLREFVYEPEPSILKAGLLNKLAYMIKDIFYYKADSKRTLLTSNRLIDSDFFKDRYRVLACLEMNFSKIKKILVSKEIGKVVLRFDIQPEKYWKTRNYFEANLSGTKTAHLFGFGNEVIICEKIKKKRYNL